MSVETMTFALSMALAIEEVLTRGALTRFVWREIARVFILLELGALRLVQVVYPPKYVLTGRCQKRGTCCTAIVGDPPRFIKRGRLLRIFVVYHRMMHNFETVGRGPDGELIFSCGHLGDDGRCRIYRHRPLLCRNYPVLPFFEPPRPIAGCGFGVAPRVVSKMTSRPSLNIVNPRVAVHHPTREGGRDRFEAPDDYEWVAPVWDESKTDDSSRESA